MPQGVIARVEQMGLDQGQPLMIGGMPVFEWAPGIAIIDDVNDNIDFDIEEDNLPDNETNNENEEDDLPDDEEISPFAPFDEDIANDIVHDNEDAEVDTEYDKMIFQMTRKFLPLLHLMKTLQMTSYMTTNTPKSTRNTTITLTTKVMKYCTLAQITVQQTTPTMVFLLMMMLTTTMNTRVTIMFPQNFSLMPKNFSRLYHQVLLIVPQNKGATMITQTAHPQALLSTLGTRHVLTHTLLHTVWMTQLRHKATMPKCFRLTSMIRGSNTGKLNRHKATMSKCFRLPLMILTALVAL